jgi:hypothetical protein
MKTIIVPTLTGETGAVFSDCEVYRYSLWRRWSPGPRLFIVIGLNPSTADAEADDPTIRRCISFAKRELADMFVMLNLFALRSTDPAGLLRDPEPIGRDNDETIWRWLNMLGSSEVSGVAVAAWGNHQTAKARADKLFDPQGMTAGELKCFGVNKDGSPKHPLYLKGTAPVESWRELRRKAAANK